MTTYGCLRNSSLPALTVQDDLHLYFSPFQRFTKCFTSSSHVCLCHSLGPGKSHSQRHGKRQNAVSATVKKEVTDTRRQHRRAHLEMEGPGAQWAQASSWASSPGRGWSRRSHWRCRGQCDRCPFPPLHRTLSRPLCPWLRLHSSDLTSAALPKAPGCEVGTDPSGRRGQVSCRPP